MERRFQKLTSNRSKLALAKAMLGKLDCIMAAQALGVYATDYSEVFPEQWRDQYRHEHDWAISHEIGDRFNSLWEQCFNYPVSEVTSQKLAELLNHARAARDQMFEVEWIDPVISQIEDKLKIAKGDITCGICGAKAIRADDKIICGSKQCKERVIYRIADEV